MDPLNKYTIPESYYPTFEQGFIHAINEPCKHLNDYAIHVKGEGEFYSMDTLSRANIHRVAHRYQKIPKEESKTGSRRFYPVGYFATRAMSKKDFVLQGRLGLTLNALHETIREAAAPEVDRNFLGVVNSDDLNLNLGGNMVIAPKSDKSFFLGTEGEGAEAVEHAGYPQGLLGVNFTGRNGNDEEVLPQQPYIDGAVATSWAQYHDDSNCVNLAKTNVIPVNYDTTGVGDASNLTIEKLDTVILALMKRHLDVNTQQFCMAITPDQFMALQQLEEFRNRDYGTAGSIVTGGPRGYKGIRFLVTPNVPIVNIGTESKPCWVRSCPVWRKQSAVFGVWEEPQTDFEKISGYLDWYNVTVQWSYGAGRRSTEDIICVHCAERELDSYGTFTLT